jgi:hypothetical protein
MIANAPKVLEHVISKACGELLLDVVKYHF